MIWDVFRVSAGGSKNYVSASKRSSFMRYGLNRSRCFICIYLYNTPIIYCRTSLLWSPTGLGKSDFDSEVTVLHPIHFTMRNHLGLNRGDRNIEGDRTLEVTINQGSTVQICHLEDMKLQFLSFDQLNSLCMYFFRFFIQLFIFISLPLVFYCFFCL